MDNFWHLQCSTCGQNLRLTVSEDNLGKTVEAICPGCGNKTPTTIGVPTEKPMVVNEYGESYGLPAEAEEAMRAVLKKIRHDPEIIRAMKVIVGHGYSPMLIFAAPKTVTPDAAANSKVDEAGEVKPGVFSAEDEEKFRNAFKIKL